MKYLALYRKYRPVKFEDVSGQDKIVEVIRNSIINNKISHAYLFCGPRGTGKTTTAKLIARTVNCLNLIDGEPCGKCESCLSINNNSNEDVIEIDAASNNGVDEIREIRDKVNLVPSVSKYKIYIIDEVHMLSTGAFNALLKTLEEPPKHVIFILATTEEHKIPATIISRCQKYNFNKISVENLIKRLKTIVQLENINVSEDVLRQIALFSDGGMRDSINMLDQIVSSKNGLITLDDVYEVNGMVSFSDICSLFDYVVDKSYVNVINLIDSFDSKGKNLFKLIEELMIFMKDVLIYKKCNSFFDDNIRKNAISNLANKVSEDFIYYFIDNINKLLSEVKLSSYPKILIQVFFVKIINFVEKNNKNANLDDGKYFPEIFPGNKKELNNEKYFPGNNYESVNNVKNVEKSESLFDEEKLTIEDNIVDREIKKIRINNALATANKEILGNIKKKWSLISEYLIDDKYSMIAGLLNDSTVVVAGKNNLILTSESESVVDRLNRNLDEINKFMIYVFDNDYKLIALNNNEWAVEKNKFIKNRNEKNMYYYISEENAVEQNDSKMSKKSVNSSINDLINIVGDDIIEYK